jgi:hypothetical protein
MIRVIVGNQHAHNIMEIQIHLTQAFLNLTGRDTGVNQYTLTTRTEVVAVSATSARKTPEYKSVSLHNNNSACKITTFF